MIDVGYCNFEMVLNQRDILEASGFILNENLFEEETTMAPIGGSQGDRGWFKSLRDRITGGFFF